ncbi:hypothetical protein NQ318_000705 [Aromia moschata]|uniref:Uncharacterized protein n=1 Tax=Aromia moschata TaxID=1265417 RepID=A0AAV8XSZ2_9CUCU|nr:hypothetical protein NQ318_000705 [Aromia moschata]
MFIFGRIYTSWPCYSPKLSLLVERKSSLDEGLHTQNPEKVNIWAGTIGENIIGPFFIDGNLNGETYLALLQNNVVPTMANLYPAEGNPHLPELHPLALPIIITVLNLDDEFGEHPQIIWQISLSAKISGVLSSRFSNGANQGLQMAPQEKIQGGLSPGSVQVRSTSANPAISPNGMSAPALTA